MNMHGLEPTIFPFDLQNQGVLIEVEL